MYISSKRFTLSLGVKKRNNCTPYNDFINPEIKMYCLLFVCK